MQYLYDHIFCERLMPTQQFFSYSIPWREQANFQ